MKLLLDVHLPAAVVAALRRKAPGIDVIHLSDWRGGHWLEAEDDHLLELCAQEGRVLVTYDQATIPPLLREWAHARRDHAGVFLGDDNSVPPENIGRVAASLVALVNEIGDADTTNLVRYLRPPKR